MQFTQTWDETKTNFMHWWRREDFGRPLLKIVGRDTPVKLPPEPKTLQDFHMSADYVYAEACAKYENATFYGEAMATLNLNIGPGSMAVYLASQPNFSKDTVWYSEAVKDGDLTALGKLRYDAEAFWWKAHQAEIRRLKALVGDQPYHLTIPDIVENVDILAAFCSPQELCYLLVDEPELVHDYINQIDDLYFSYYDPIRKLVEDADGGCCYTAFEIWSPGRTAKVQCDFSALLSPEMFCEFVMPSLEKQLERLDYTLFHLDGRSCLCHADAVLSLSRLNALQWTPGAGQPDAGEECWFPLYDKVRAAGKGLWLNLSRETAAPVEEYIWRSRRLVERYGTAGLYFLYPHMTNADAARLYAAAQNGFRE